MRIFFSVVTLLTVLNLQAQQISVSTKTLNFGNVYETQDDSLEIVISNNIGKQITVNQILFFEHYKNQVFYTNQKPFTLANGASKTIFIHFAPNQNVNYLSQVVFVTNSSGSFAVELKGQGKFSKSYYDITENLSEQALKDALNTRLAQFYTALGYNGARDYMYATLDNVNGQVECVYTGRKATFNTLNGANQNNFNCEHTFPQSFFNSNNPMQSDIHHLYPTDATANSQRSNNPFGVITGTPAWSVGGSKRLNSIFEPRDEHKGAVARTMLYFVIRYQDFSSFTASQESILRTWHSSYPPNQKDIDRNEGIFSVQNNRNFLVDYPQFIDRISSFTSTSSAPMVRNILFPQSQLNLDTVYTTQNIRIYYTVANKGNSIENFTQVDLLGAQGISVDSTIGNFTLLPGQAIQIPLKVVKGYIGNISGNLQITSTYLGGTTQQISITGFANSKGAISVPETMKENQLFLFPNPASQTLQLSDAVTAKFQIFDSYGRVVMHGQLNNKNQINISELPAGYYQFMLYKTTNIENVRFYKIP